MKKSLNMVSCILAFLMMTGIFSGGASEIVYADEVQGNTLSVRDTGVDGGTEIQVDADDFRGQILQNGGLPSSEQVGLQYTNPELELHLYNSLMRMEKEISLTGFDVSMEEIVDLFLDMLNSHPDLFHVDFLDNFYADYEGNLISVEPLYYYSEAKAKEMHEDFADEVSKVKALIQPWMTDLEIALVVNDYLTVHAEYDVKNYNQGSIPYESYTAYGTLVNKTAVCQGYALTYLYLMERIFGVPTEYVVSDAMNHAWNAVKIGDDYYHVDVTWNDPITDRPGRARHEYFLVSDQEFKNRKHYDWSSPVSAENTKYDQAFWTEYDAPYARIADKYYYVSEDEYIMVWDASTGKHQAIKDVSARWYSTGNSYYLGSFTHVTSMNGKLYYSMPDGIHSILADGTGGKKELSIGDSTKGLIYSMFSHDGVVQYVQSTTPILSGEEPVMTANLPLGTSVRAVKLDQTQMYLAAGKSKTLTASVEPSDAMNKGVYWKSSNPLVATVEDGLITGVRPGQTTITAASLDGDKTATVTVKVTQNEYVNELDFLAGESRYTTAVEISKAQYATSETAVLVLGTNFPDALAAGPLSRKHKAPILLTQQSRVSASTLAELKRLKVKNVILLGGEAVIGSEVEKILKNNEVTGTTITKVERISGNNRYETAVAAAEKLSAEGKVPKVILASGESFADALAVGSYASREGLPILLTRKASLSGATRTALEKLGVEEVLILGGEAAVGKAVEDELKSSYTVTRISGDNRYATAVAISERFFTDPEQAIVASGVDFADALAAAPLAAEMDIPILLVGTRKVSSSVGTYLAGGFTKLHVIGGTSAISDETREELLELINQP